MNSCTQHLFNWRGIHTLDLFFYLHDSKLPPAAPLSDFISNFRDESNFGFSIVKFATNQSHTRIQSILRFFMATGPTIKRVTISGYFASHIASPRVIATATRKNRINMDDHFVFIHNL